MRKKYKTLEEMRAANAERQARWRKRNKGFARLRERNAKRAIRGGAPVSDVSLTKGGLVPNVIIEYGELEYGKIEGVDEAYGGEQKRRVPDMARASEPGISGADPGGPREETREEVKVQERLRELRERQARGGLGKRAGVMVPELRL
jgi:hypothetical protein